MCFRTVQFSNCFFNDASSLFDLASRGKRHHTVAPSDESAQKGGMRAIFKFYRGKKYFYFSWSFIRMRSWWGGRFCLIWWYYYFSVLLGCNNLPLYPFLLLNIYPLLFSFGTCPYSNTLSLLCKTRGILRSHWQGSFHMEILWSKTPPLFLGASKNTISQ